MKIFVSWSKEPSKKIAEEVKHLVEMTLPSTSVWMSEVDIGKGARWNVQVTNELDKTDVGIICCTENNLFEPWLHFEAGALSKSVTEGMVHPLCFGVDFAQLPGTLSQFQATKFDRGDILRLLHGLNDKAESKAKPTDVDAKFARAWRGFEQAVNEELVTAAKAATNRKASNLPPPSSKKDQSAATLSKGAVELLKMLAQRGGDLSVAEVSQLLNVHTTRAQHYLNELALAKYVSISPALMSGMSTTYYISGKGTALAVEQDWV